MFTNSLPFMAWGVHFSLFTFRCSLIRFYQYKKNTPRTTLPNLKSNFKRKVLRVGHKV